MLLNLFGPVLMSLTFYGFTRFLYSIISKSLEKRRIKKEKELDELHGSIRRSASAVSSEKNSDPDEEEKIYEEIRASQEKFDLLIKRAEQNNRLKIFPYKIFLLIAGIVFLLTFIHNVFMYFKFGHFHNIIYKLYIASLFVVTISIL